MFCLNDDCRVHYQHICGTLHYTKTIIYKHPINVYDNLIIWLLFNLIIGME